jgi:TolB-like protein
VCSSDLYSLGILPFEDHTNNPSLMWFRQGLPDMLTTDLALVPGLQVVQRSQLGEILREQWLQQRGSSDPKPSVHIGRLVGARYLLSGSFHEVGDELVLEAHLLDVELGTVVGTARSAGPLDTIPAFTRDLAEKIGRLFVRDPQPMLGNRRLGELPRPNQESQPPIHPGQKDIATEHLDEPWSSPNVVLAMDTLLRLDRVQRIREEAQILADRVWHKGISINLGDVHDQKDRKDLHSITTVSVAWIPIKVFLQRDKVERLHNHLKITPSTDSATPDVGSLFLDEKDLGARALFRQRMKDSRRLFVRALNAMGEVVAVSSAWPWRVERLVQFPSEGGIEVPFWPKPLVSGWAGFPKGMLTSSRKDYSFDVIIVSVPREQRVVSVDLIQPQPEELSSSILSSKSEGSIESTIGSRDVQMLQSWFLEQWDPPVMEAVPFDGYLPGNYRSAQLLVTGVGGVVGDVRVIKIPKEEPLATSIKQVATQLVGQCFWDCDPLLAKGDIPSDPFKIRVQLDLIKDIGKVGLGGKG